MKIFVKSDGSFITSTPYEMGDSALPSFSERDITNIVPQPTVGWTDNGDGTYTAPGLPNLPSGRGVTFSTNGTLDSYLVNGSNLYRFPAGTSQAVVYLAISKKEKLLDFMGAMRAMIAGQYDIEVRDNLREIAKIALGKGFTNRVAYLAQLDTWADSINTYAESVVVAVNALSDSSIVASYSWDLSSLIAGDPLVTAIAAYAINN